MTPKEVFDKIRENTGDIALAAQCAQLTASGPTFYKCISIANERYGEELMYNECLDVLYEVYGKRLENMKPYTIAKKMRDLMGIAISDPDMEVINETIQDWINI